MITGPAGEPSYGAAAPSPASRRSWVTRTSRVMTISN